MAFKKETCFYRTFLISICVVTILIMCGIFWLDSSQDEDLIQEEFLARARAQVNTMVLLREWNARNGGVFVERRKDTPTYAALAGEDVALPDGRVFTKKNHAAMTREISEISRQNGASLIRITSLKPLDPHNVPDPFEEMALKSFRSGEKERFMLEKVGERSVFRYMAPLFVTGECLTCHVGKGYRIGEPLGGISISFPVDDMQGKMNRNTLLVFASCVLATGLLLLVLWRLAARLIKKLADARSVIEELAITDGLTRIYNRRHVTERFEEEFERGRRLHEELGCIIFDVDHFKQVNDGHGHQIGDVVLKAVASITTESVRSFDIVGRLGGDEFMVVLPETDLEEAVIIAERLRSQVEREHLASDEGGEPIAVTLSLGVAAMHRNDLSVDDIIKRADESLYAAKRAGRNRVGIPDGVSLSTHEEPMFGACGRRMEPGDNVTLCKSLFPSQRTEAKWSSEGAGEGDLGNEAG
ncbi:sensor domain-containing diguanylate cyclase [Geomesophilobacter sediminis]|uniref:diguanylate cyclase n=1 Tax=Geomesophilobacter sediminis TaxID=2798584 RepID=A0A8J7LYR5_9BACT|nr:diguanylate cyclase [Geomesophilobacter sediminis]MBJ6725446.1 diguanylate cyclase [Geomesophilobacter sediminis]